MKTDKAGYETCSSSSSAISAATDSLPGVYNAGDFIYKVESAEDVELYFICTKFKHCEDNQKIKIIVEDTAHSWNLQLGSDEMDKVRGATLDSNTGHIIVVGETWGSFASHPDATYGKSLGGLDGIIFAVDSISGKKIWDVQEGTSSNER